MIKRILLLLLLLAGTEVFTQDQTQPDDENSFTVGSDFVSRYYWRGQILADAPCIQPSATFTMGGFSLGLWGSYAFDDAYSIANEVNFIAAYTFTIPLEMNITIGLEDYYYPNAGLGFLNFRNHDDPLGPGAHMVAASLAFEGPESFPISLTTNVNVYNDPGYNTYFEVAYPWEIGGTSVSIFAGVTPGSSKNFDYYFTDEFALVNAGVTLSRDIRITESFSLPVSVTLGINPKLDVSQLVFGITL